MGIPLNASQAEWKTAYRMICKSEHPDNLGVHAGMTERYYLASEAYAYLEREAAGGKKTLHSGRIIGRPENVAKRTDSYAERQRKLEKQRRREAELRKQAEEMQKQQFEKEKEIMDEIRWIRLAGLIHNAIENDRREKEIEKKTNRAFSKYQENIKAGEEPHDSGR